MIRYKSGDLLNAPVEALVNTVNTVGIMGKGLALQFKRAYPDNFSAYEAACRRKEVRIGKMFLYDRGENVQPRYIINFPTKTHWRLPSRLEYIKEGLKDLVQIIQEREIRSIAVPPLGVGNGNLNWDDVRSLILEVLRPIERDVEILIYVPSETSHNLKPLMSKPSMNVNRAALLSLMNYYGQLNEKFGRTEAQKLAYFLQESGFDLKLNFQQGKYGPYADALNHVLQRFEGHYIIGYGDRNTRSEIVVLPDVMPEVNRYLVEQHPEAYTSVARTIELIQGFEGAYGLELLSTVHWSVKYREARNFESLKMTLKKWNSRKALLPEDHICAALHYLFKRKALDSTAWEEPIPKLPKKMVQQHV